MNIKQLEYFVDLSQTAITKQIQCLEKDLGIPLFKVCQTY